MQYMKIDYIVQGYYDANQNTILFCVLGELLTRHSPEAFTKSGFKLLRVTEDGEIIRYE